MTLQGVVRNGVVVFDGPVALPDGTRVHVVVGDEGNEPSLANLLDLAGTVDGLPADMARNHDHYLHGQPIKPPVAERDTLQEHRQRVCEILSQTFDTDQLDLAAHHDEHQS